MWQKNLKGRQYLRAQKKLQNKTTILIYGVQKTGFVKLRNYPLTLRTTCSSIVGKQDSIKTFNTKNGFFIEKLFVIKKVFPPKTSLSAASLYFWLTAALNKFVLPFRAWY